jgi:hypothetical protein
MPIFILLVYRISGKIHRQPGHFQNSGSFENGFGKPGKSGFSVKNLKTMVFFQILAENTCNAEYSVV